MFSVCKRIHAGERECQDRAEFFEQGSDLILVLADGAGGLGGGAEAAEFAVQGVRKSIASTSLTPDGLTTLLSSIDRQMAEIAAFGETTCVVVALSGRGLAGASVGDSGAFVFARTGADNLTGHQIRKPFLGSGRAIPVGFARERFDGTIIVASDGLLKYAPVDNIAAAAVLDDLNDAANKLVDMVRYRSGALPDDVSIVLARRR